MRNGVIKAALVSSAIWPMLLASPASAQTATAPSSRDETNRTAGASSDSDIIVTANKREERLIDVAASVSAVSGDQLTERRLIDLQDLTSRVPGLNLQRGGNSVGQRLVIRGLNTGGAGATVASTVDDVPLTFSSSITNGADFAADFDPFDLNRVEVLRGPQGTLYGASAEGGLIKYVTNAPATDETAGGAEVSLFTLAHAKKVGASGKGFANLPISEGVAAIRVTGYYEYQPGWIDNILAGRTNTNESKRYGGRVSLLATPTDGLTLRASALYQKLKSSDYDQVEVFGVSNPSDPFKLRQGYNFNTFLPQPSSVESQLYYISGQYDLGGVTLQSITSYGKLNTSFSFDSPLYGIANKTCVGLNQLCFGRPNTTLVSSSASQLKKFNQEFRLASDNDAAKVGHGLEWQLGVFYTQERSLFRNNYITRDITTGAAVTTPLAVKITPPGTPQIFLAELRSKFREIAGYADATYHFSPQFDLELGARVFNNKERFTQRQGGAIFSPPDFVTFPAQKSSETDFTFSVAPRFRITPDVMLYARVASGYRAGGPNAAIPAAGPGDPPGDQPPSSFSSDRTVNYEAGLKGTFFNNMLSVDLAGFYIDWTDIQVGVSIIRGFTQYPATVNAGKAVSKGFEWNFELRPVRGLSFGWLGAYTDARLTRDVPGINAFNHDRLPYVPKWQTTLSADYTFAAYKDIEAFIGGSYTYTGDRRNNFNFRPSLSHLVVPSYETFALQGGLRTDRFTIQIYGKNLGDVRGVTNYGGGRTLALPPAFGIPPIVIPGNANIIRPREVGVRLSGRF